MMIINIFIKVLSVASELHEHVTGVLGKLFIKQIFAILPAHFYYFNVANI